MRTAQDPRSWLELYRFWNEGGQENVESMLRVLFERHVAPVPRFEAAPTVVETPGIGCLHPLAPGRYFLSPREYLDWRLSADAAAAATAAGAELAPAEAPRVAVLLFRKHVITKQPYIPGNSSGRWKATGCCRSRSSSTASRRTPSCATS